MMTFEEYIKKEDKEVDEDEMVAAPSAPASDGVVDAPHGTTDADVLGKCDHDNCGGFFKKDCFHIPKPVFKQPLSRLVFPGDKKRKKKRKNWQKVQIIADSQLSDAAKKTLSSLSEDDLINFISDNYDVSYYDVFEVVSAAYSERLQMLFIKFYELGNASYSTRFVKAKIADGKLQPIDKNSVPKTVDEMHQDMKLLASAGKLTICWQ